MSPVLKSHFRLQTKVESVSLVLTNLETITHVGRRQGVWAGKKEQAVISEVAGLVGSISGKSI